MIVEYHRPTTIKEAVSLLNRKQPVTVPMGGGLFLNETSREDIAVVDIQDLPLGQVDLKGKKVHLGAGVTLQEMILLPELQPAVRDSILHQDTYNRRHVATLGGALAACTGRSPLAVVILVLDAVLELHGPEGEVDQEFFGELLPLREEHLAGRLITRVTLPRDVLVSYHFVARSPADQPIVSAAVAAWPSGRIRVVLGGTCSQPRLVLDGPDGEGAVQAAEDAYSQVEDPWASAEYRSHTAGILVGRCLAEIEKLSER